MLFKKERKATNQTKTKQTKMSVERKMKAMDEATLVKMKRELQMWSQLGGGDDSDLAVSIADKTNYQIKIDLKEVGQEKAAALEAWWEEGETMDDIMCDVIYGGRLVDNTPNNWQISAMGERWCDTIINRRLVRITFYSRRFDKVSIHKDFDYLLSFNVSVSHWVPCRLREKNVFHIYPEHDQTKIVVEYDEEGLFKELEFFMGGVKQKTDKDTKLIRKIDDNDGLTYLKLAGPEYELDPSTDESVVCDYDREWN